MGVKKSAARAPHSGQAKKQLASAPDLTGASCGTYQYSATAYYSDGTSHDVTTSTGYLSSNTAVATIDSTGVATGLSTGTATIAAQLSQISAPPVTLQVNALNSITILPANSSIASGGTANFTSTGNFTYWDGTTGSQDLSGLAAWASSNPDVATIDPASGVAAAVGGGSTTISSTVCGVTATTSLTVGSATPVSLLITPSSSLIAVGQTQAYTVQELWSDGSKHPCSEMSTGPAMKRVSTDEGTGLTVGTSVGSGNIGATELGTTLTGTSSCHRRRGCGALRLRGRYRRRSRSACTKDCGQSRSAHTPICAPHPNLRLRRLHKTLLLKLFRPTPLNVTGAALTPITGITTSAVPQQVFLHPSGKFLYYIDFNSNLYVLDVNPATWRVECS